MKKKGAAIKAAIKAARPGAAAVGKKKGWGCCTTKKNLQNFVPMRLAGGLGRLEFKGGGGLKSKEQQSIYRQ